MLHGVPVNIIDMLPIVDLISNKMLPETSVPDTSLASFFSTLLNSLASINLPGKISFDQTPAGRKIGIANRQGQNTMQMLGQHNHRVNFKTMTAFNLRNSHS